jgi:hypothetical protein
MISEPDTLLAALGRVGDDASVAEHGWTAAAATRRCHTIAWLRIQEALRGLPTRRETWQDALPATSDRQSVWTDEPRGAVDWPTTIRVAGGWPPPAPGRVRYRTRVRRRQGTHLALAVLFWVRTRVGHLRAAAVAQGYEIDPDVAARLDAIPPPPTTPPTPTWSQMEAVTALGAPWSSLRTPLNLLARLEGDPLAFARDFLLPDPDLRWRLFHLGCYAELLHQVGQRAGVAPKSVEPLSASGRRPSDSLALPDGARLDFWFEASGIWGTRGETTTAHRQVRSAAVRGQAGLTPDICAVLLRDGAPSRAAVLECKFSRNPAYFFGSGYPQVLGYTLELGEALGVPVLGAVVPPSDTLLRSAKFAVPSGQTREVHVGIAEPSSAAEVVTRWLFDGTVTNTV